MRMNEHICLSLGVNKAVMSTVEIAVGVGDGRRSDVFPHHTKLVAVEFGLLFVEEAALARRHYLDGIKEEPDRIGHETSCHGRLGELPEPL